MTEFNATTAFNNCTKRNCEYGLIPSQQMIEVSNYLQETLMTVKTLAQIKHVERLNCLLKVATSFYSNLNMCFDSMVNQTKNI